MVTVRGYVPAHVTPRLTPQSGLFTSQSDPHTPVNKLLAPSRMRKYRMQQHAAALSEFGSSVFIKPPSFCLSPGKSRELFLFMLATFSSIALALPLQHKADW